MNLKTLLLCHSIFNESDRFYWGSAGAGAIVFAKKTQKFLFGLRSDQVMEPGTWGGFGGKVDGNESPEDAVQREVAEEIGDISLVELVPLNVYKDGTFKYYNYLAVVEDEFVPSLNWENDDYTWVEYGNWPNPLHFGARHMLSKSDKKLKQMVTNLNPQLAEDAINAVPAKPPVQMTQKVPVASAPAKRLSEQELKDAYVVVATLWGEARGEGKQGMQAVLNVIMNRARGDFANAKGVVLRPKQFSVWNGNTNAENYSLELAHGARNKKISDIKQYQEALELVDLAMKGKLTDITGGATFYFNPKKVTPSWAKKLVFTKRIGHHDFYKVPPKKKVVKK